MRQHVCHWCAICKDEANIEVGCGPKQDVSPSLANLCECVPPSFTVPRPPTRDTVKITLVPVKDGWSIEIKDVKKGIIVEDVDRSNSWTLT